MPQSLASRRDSPALAAAMSRHPASGGQGAATALFGADLPGGSAPAGPVAPASFATVAAVLTGPWRVDDPVGFAAAMRAAPLVAGHVVVDLWRLTPNWPAGRLPVLDFAPGAPGAPGAPEPAAGLDPHSAAVAGQLEAAVAAAAGRSGLAVRWVAARVGPGLFVEAAARTAADGEGPELLVLGHLVEPLAGVAAAADDSWVVIVVGDGRGGVAGVTRALLDRRLPARLQITALRQRLAEAARAAEGFGPPASEMAPEGVVLPFRR